MDILCSTEKCSAGYYRAACTPALQGKCTRCGNKKPERAHYSGAAELNAEACPWACDDGYGVVERGLCSLLDIEFFQPFQVAILLVAESVQAFVEFQQEAFVADMAAGLGTSDISILSVTEVRPPPTPHCNLQPAVTSVI